jgi:F-type H+-transporting ATPase subunit a
MPQSTLSTGSIGAHRQGAFQLAQAEPPKNGQSADQAGTTHSETAKNEEPPQGEVPNAQLLLWNSGLVVLLMLAFALAARRRLENIPRGLQNWAEYAVEQLNAFTVGIIGEGGEKYTPLVGTVFLYIFLMNLVGIIPGFHSPTANITITLALGLVVFLYTEYVGIRDKGIFGYFKHFMGPKLELFGIDFPWLFPLMLPVELISTYVRPFTLAVRLFGNIFGEDVIILVLAGLGASMAGRALGWLPLQFPVLLLSLLTDGVQAMVFAILICIYISLNSHHEEGEHGEEGPASGAAHAHGGGH